MPIDLPALHLFVFGELSALQLLVFGELSTLHLLVFVDFSALWTVVVHAFFVVIVNMNTHEGRHIVDTYRQRPA